MTEDTGLGQVNDTPEVESDSGQNQPEITIDPKQSLSSQSDKITELANRADKADVMDLDNVPKFKWKGKEWSLKELESSTQRFQDYTKKTQEIAAQRAEMQKTQSYWENLQYDLKNVKENPSLAEAFKKTYPEQFHAYLDFILQGETINKGATTLATGQPSATTQSQEQRQDPRIDEMSQRLEQLSEHYHEQRVQAATDFVNATFDRMTQKYPSADEETVIARVIRLNEMHKDNPREYKKPDEKVIEDLFKASEQKQISFAKTWQQKVQSEQMAANESAKGPAGGGAVAGAAPRIARTIKEAQENLINDPSW